MTVIMPSAGPGQVPNLLFRNRHGDGTGTRLLFVAGLRGDELSGVYALGRLHQRLRDLAPPGCDQLRGTLDLHPIAHPMGVDGLGFPSRDPHPPADAVGSILAAAQGATACIHLTMGPPELEEIPQIHLSPWGSARLLPAAQAAGVDVVWIRRRWEPGSLAATLEEAGIPTLALHLSGSPPSARAADELCRGLLSVSQALGALGGDPAFAGNPPPEALITSDDDVASVRSQHTGVYVPRPLREPDVWEGDLLGAIQDPLTGEISAEVRAPVHGFLLARRAWGMVRPGSELARIGAFGDL